MRSLGIVLALGVASVALAGSVPTARKAIEDGDWVLARAEIDDLLRDRMSTRKMEEVDAMAEQVDYELARAETGIVALDAYIERYRTGPYIRSAHTLRCERLLHAGRDAFTAADLTPADAFLNGGCPEGRSLFVTQLIEARARAFQDDSTVLLDLVDRFPTHAVTPQVKARAGELLYDAAPDNADALLTLIETYSPAPWVAEATKRADDLSWSDLGDDADLDALNTYLAHFPQGAYRDEVISRRLQVARGLYRDVNGIWLPHEGAVDSSDRVFATFNVPISRLSVTARNADGEAVPLRIGDVELARRTDTELALRLTHWTNEDGTPGPVPIQVPCNGQPPRWVRQFVMSAHGPDDAVLAEWVIVPDLEECDGSNLFYRTYLRPERVPLALFYGFSDQDLGPGNDACPMRLVLGDDPSTTDTIRLYSGTRRVGSLSRPAEQTRGYGRSDACRSAGWSGRFSPTSPPPPPDAVTNVWMWGASAPVSTQPPTTHSATVTAARTVLPESQRQNFEADDIVWADLDGDGAAEAIVERSGEVIVVNPDSMHRNVVRGRVVAWYEHAGSLSVVVLDERGPAGRIHLVGASDPNR